MRSTLYPKSVGTTTFIPHNHVEQKNNSFHIIFWKVLLYQCINVNHFFGRVKPQDRCCIYSFNSSISHCLLHHAPHPCEGPVWVTYENYGWATLILLSYTGRKIYWTQNVSLNNFPIAQIVFVYSNSCKNLINSKRDVFVYHSVYAFTEHLHLFIPHFTLHNDRCKHYSSLYFLVLDVFVMNDSNPVLYSTQYSSKHICATLC